MGERDRVESLDGRCDRQLRRSIASIDLDDLRCDRANCVAWQECVLEAGAASIAYLDRLSRSFISIVYLDRLSRSLTEWSLGSEQRRSGAGLHCTCLHKERH